jgi:predicted glycosyltransferase
MSDDHSAADVATAPARRVLFYSHDGTGLGHLRITLGVAGAYAAVRPQDSLLLLTGSLQAGAFPLPNSLDYVKLPAMPKREIYASLPPTEGYTGAHNSTIRFRAALALATFQAFAPELVVVDHAPAGLFRELAPTFEWMRGLPRRPLLALLMRDITFGPEQTRKIWTNEGVYPLLDDWYDRILVYGDREVFDPLAAYDLSPAAAAKTVFCGYLSPAPPRRAPDAVRLELGATGMPLVAVSAGGGHDGAALIGAYLAGLRERSGPRLFSYVVTGPLLADDERARVSALADGLPDLRIVEFDPDYAAVVAAADVVVSMGGYNSLTEAVSFGKRPVVVPRLPGPEEQILRAVGLARLDLATVVPPESLRPATLWSAIDGEFRRPPPSSPSLPFDALDRIACELAGLGAH